MATGLLATLGLKKKEGPPPTAAKGGPPRAATVKAAATTDVPPPPVDGTDAADAAPPSPDEFSPVITKPVYLDPSSPQMRALLMKGIQEKADKDRKEAEQTLVKMNKAVADVKAYVLGMPQDQLARAGYAVIMKDVRDRFPDAAGLAQWVKETQRNVPDLKDKLPRPQAVMDALESAVKARYADLGWSMSTGKDLKTVATDRLLAAYMSELPAGVTVNIEGGVVKLGLTGAALTVKTPAGEVDANVGKGGAAIALKRDDFTIKVQNDGWKEFDPKLRGQWQSISDATTIVLKLQADRDKAKLELEQKKKDGTQITADLTADFDKKEAVFNLAWKKLQEKITATAKASEDKITASIAYLKKDKDDKEAVKAGVDAEVDLKALKGTLDAYYKTPTLEGALKVAAAADKVSAKLEVTAVKSGVVVTAEFEKALDETKAAIEVLVKEGSDSSTTVAAELKKKADDLTAKIKIVQQTKDLKLAAELEKTLKDVRGSIEVEYKKGITTVKGGASGSSTGEVGGKVQIDIALGKGCGFVGENDKLSFAANVSTSGYKFEVNFSMGEPVDPTSLQDLFKDADTQIKELYKLAGDKGIRSIQDAETLNKKMQDIMKKVDDTAKKAKTLKSKQEISATFGFSVQGDWPQGGKATPPAVVAGVTIHF
jgi:hypothetical protein